MRFPKAIFHLVFLAVPPLGTLALGLLALSQSVDTQAAALANILWPTVGTVFLAALIGWAVFLRPPQNVSAGKKAGLLTVFLCYLLGLIPLAIEAGSWDGMVGVLSIYFVVFVFGQIATFWIAYPIGAIFGRWIAKRML